MSAKIVTKRYEKIGGRGVYEGYCYVTVEKNYINNFHILTNISSFKNHHLSNLLSLHQNIALRGALMPNQVTKKYSKGIPYDLSCPSTKKDIQKRLCLHCGLYFGTIKSLNKHRRHCKKPSSNQEIAEQQIRVRPIRVAARRQRELLCVMEMQELEWHDIDDVDVDIGEDAMQNVADVHYGIGTPVF